MIKWGLQCKKGKQAHGGENPSGPVQSESGVRGNNLSFCQLNYAKILFYLSLYVCYQITNYLLVQIHTRTPRAVSY